MRAAHRILIWLTALKIAGGVAALPLIAAPNDGGFPLWIFAAHLATFGGVGAWLVAGARDGRASDLGTVYLLIGSLFADRPLQLATVGMPAIPAAGALFLAAVHPDAWVAVFLWNFASSFPRESPIGWPSRLPAAAWRIAVPVGALLFSVSALLGAWEARRTPHPAPSWLAAIGPHDLSGLYWLALLGLLLPCLPYMLWRARAASITERRRVAVLATGVAIGIGPMVVEVLLELLVPPFRRVMNDPAAGRVGAAILYPLLLSTPVTTAYAVAVRQVLDVRLIVRSALRYALARAALVATLSVPFLLLSWYALEQRAASVASLLTGTRVLILGALLVAAALAFTQRRRLLEQLDRRFFREQYDAQQILARLIERSRRAETPAELATLLDTEIDRALHLDRTATLARDPLGLRFESPTGSAPPLPVDTALARLLPGSTDPLDVDLDRSGTPFVRLPSLERNWLAEGGFRLLVPLVAHDGVLAGLIGLGQKRSELPFSADDRRLLAAIASSGAMALENMRLRTPSPRASGAHHEARATPAPSPDRPAAECQRCGLLMEPDTRPCPSCGGDAAPAPIPLVLRHTFQFERRIGSGGMGVVYAARDLTLARLVAIKTLPALSAENVMRLRREAQAMASVVHPNLATIYGAEMWQGTPLLMEEYLHGGTLADRLRHGPLPVADVIELGTAVAGAIERLHQRGVLHRDIKPSNIGFTADGVPKLLDFGLAKFFAPADAPLRALDGDETRPNALALGADADSRSSGQMIGTPLYFSPETIRMEPPDASVDLWALAMVLLEALIGRHPLRASTLYETMDRIVRGPVPDPRGERADCPTALADFFARALHADRARRPASAREVRLALGRLRSAEDVGVA